MSISSNVTVNIDVYNDGSYISYQTLYNDLENDIGVTCSMLLIQLSVLYNELIGEDKVFNGFTNSVTNKTSSITELRRINMPHILVSIRDWLNLMDCYDDTFAAIGHSYLLVPRLGENGRVGKYIIENYLNEISK